MISKATFETIIEQYIKFNKMLNETRSNDITPVETWSTMGGQEISPTCLRLCQLQRQLGKIVEAMAMKNEKSRKKKKREIKSIY